MSCHVPTPVYNSPKLAVLYRGTQRHVMYPHQCIIHRNSPFSTGEHSVMSCTRTSGYFAETLRSLRTDTVSCHVPTPVYNSPNLAVLYRGTQCHVMYPHQCIIHRNSPFSTGEHSVMSCTRTSGYFAESLRSLRRDTVSCHVPTPVYDSLKLAVRYRGTQCHVMYPHQCVICRNSPFSTEGHSVMSCRHTSVYFAETRRSVQGDTVSCHVPTPVYNSPKLAVRYRGTQCHVMYPHQCVICRNSLFSTGEHSVMSCTPTSV